MGKMIPMDGHDGADQCLVEYDEQSDTVWLTFFAGGDERDCVTLPRQAAVEIGEAIAGIARAAGDPGPARKPSPEAVKADLVSRQVEDLQARVAALEAIEEGRETSRLEQGERR